MFFNVFYKSEKNMFFYVFYSKINVFIIYDTNTAVNDNETMLVMIMVGLMDVVG